MKSTSEKEAMELVNCLIDENSSSDSFNDAIPSNWPIEAWRILLDVRSEKWDLAHFHTWIAGHAYAPEEIVRMLAKNTERRVRMRVAEKRNLPTDLFLELAKDCDEGVRQSVARNKKTPKDIMRYLENDRSNAVRDLVKLQLKLD